VNASENSENAPKDEIPREPASTARFPGAEAWATLPGRVRALLGGGALVAVVLLMWAVASGGPGDSVTPQPSPSAQASLEEGPRVAPLDGCTLLTGAEIEEAMGLLDIHLVERIVLEFGGGEACTWVHHRNGVAVEGLSVRFGPGAVDDFEPEARLEGVTGQTVSGVGQLAVWFGGNRVGTLSVVTESSLGYVFVRVTVARPDLEASDILPLARDLATAALPRFPGMEAEPSEPVTVTIEHEPPDTSNVGWVDNLLAKEASGEWTQGEGLVATLKVFAGELDADEVRLHPDLLDDSGTGIITLAQAYLEDGPDATARAEIARLLELLILSREQLEGLSGIGPPRVQLAAHRGPPGPALPRRVGDICEYIGATSPCLIPYAHPDLSWLDQQYGEGKYRINVPSNFAEVGWKDDHLGWAASAMRTSATFYEDLGMMAPVDFVITPWGGAHLITYAATTCFININQPMQEHLEAPFKQRIAAEMAYCMFAATVPELAPEAAGSGRWWADGLAWYLSNSVYPAPRCDGDRCDLEWPLSGPMAAQELGTDLFHRAAPNALFFQHMRWLVGDDDDIMRLIRSLPAGGGSAGQAEAVAGYRDMERIFHEFAMRLTDASVGDTGGETVPYDPDATDISISSAPTIVLRDLQPFWTERLAIEVADGMKACIEYTDPGTSMTSWRPGSEGEDGIEGGWSDELPEIIEDDLVLVVTTTKSGESISLTATKLIPADEDECNPASPPPQPPQDGCLPIICAPSDYFKSLANLPTWFHDLLD
jgi:hypothetical protein